VAIEGDTFGKFFNTGGHISEMWQYRGTCLGNVAIQGNIFRKCGNTGRHNWEMLQ